AGAADTFGATSGTTNGSGLFTTTLKTTSAGPRTITCVAGPVGQTISLTLKFDFVGSATVAATNPLVIVHDPGGNSSGTGVKYGQPFAWVLKAVDANGNLASTTGTATVDFQNGQDKGNTVAGTTTITVNNGMLNYYG